MAELDPAHWVVQLLLKHPQLIAALKRAIEAADEFEQMRRGLMDDAERKASMEFRSDVWAKLLDPAIGVAVTTVDWIPAEQPRPRPIAHVLAEIASKECD